MSIKKQIILGVILGGFILILPFVIPEKTSTMTPEQIAELEELERQAKIPIEEIRDSFTMNPDDRTSKIENIFIERSYTSMEKYLSSYGIDTKNVNIKVKCEGIGHGTDIHLYVTAYNGESVDLLREVLNDNILKEVYKDTHYTVYLKDVYLY